MRRWPLVLSAVAPWSTVPVKVSGPASLDLMERSSSVSPCSCSASRCCCSGQGGKTRWPPSSMVPRRERPGRPQPRSTGGASRRRRPGRRASTSPPGIRSLLITARDRARPPRRAGMTRDWSCCARLSGVASAGQPASERTRWSGHADISRQTRASGVTTSPQMDASDEFRECPHGWRRWTKCRAIACLSRSSTACAPRSS